MATSKGNGFKAFVECLKNSRSHEDAKELSKFGNGGRVQKGWCCCSDVDGRDGLYFGNVEAIHWLKEQKARKRKNYVVRSQGELTYDAGVFLNRRSRSGKVADLQRVL